MTSSQIGCDIIKIKRIKKAYNKYGKNFLKRFLNQKEIALFNSYSQTKKQYLFLAGRWAAKEAIYKALEGKASWQEVKNLAIINDSHSCPRIENKNSLWNISISISHEKKYAMATALVKNIDSDFNISKK